MTENQVRSGCELHDQRSTKDAAPAAVPSELVKNKGPETVRCSCGADVSPAGKGHCPVCGRFLPSNAVALVHGAHRLQVEPKRENRRLQLRAEVRADLGGHVPPIIREVAEDFVSACVLRDQLVEHLEAIGPLTQRGTRRAAMDLYLATSSRIERLSVLLGTFRDTAKAKTKTTTNPLPGLSSMPSSALDRARDLLTRLSQREALSDRERGQLDVLRAAMRGDLVLPTSDPSDTSVNAPDK